VGGALLAAVLLPGASFAANCPNEALRVGPSAHLPDCRAYEQVTPVAKNAGQFSVGVMGVSPDGTSNLVLDSFAAIAGIEDDATVIGGYYGVSRTESGWVTSALPPPASLYESANEPGNLGPLMGISLDGSTAIWADRAKGQPENQVELVSRKNGVVTDVGPLIPPGTAPDNPDNVLQAARVTTAGYSDDMSHLLFMMTPHGQGAFWPFDETVLAPGARSLYEYIGADDAAPLLIGVNDQGALISRCSTSLGGEGAGFGTPGRKEFHNAMSTDGLIVFFTSLACASGPSVNELYARIDNGEAGAHTVAISEPSSADCPLCDTSSTVLRPAYFEGASQHGSTVFFTTTQPLLGSDTSNNIYEYDFDPPAGQPKVVRVSGGDETVANSTAEVEGVVRTSEDGTHVYFVAKGVLTTSANSFGQVAHQGSNNFYVFERDAAYPQGRTIFIADLSEADHSLWEPEVTPHHVDATPDGRFLVFLSSTHLTPDDTSGISQVFEYDAETGAMVRASIGQNGYNNNGNSSEGETAIRAPNFISQGRSAPSSYWSNLTVSSDGSYVFFESTVALTQQAINNAEIYSTIENKYKLVANVYEYHDGNVFLISDGKDIGGTVGLVGTDASGRDVFFNTLDKLVPQDTDSNSDIYDARIEGGFPAAVVPVECSGDACQGPLSAPPVLLSPGSEFQAGANVASTTVASPTVKAKAKSKAKAKKKKITKKKKRSARKARRADHSNHVRGGTGR